MRRNGRIAFIFICLLLYLLCSIEIETGAYLTLISRYEFLSPGLMYAKEIGQVLALFPVGLLLVRLRRPVGASGVLRAFPALLGLALLVPIICFLLYLFGFFAMWSLPAVLLRIARASIRTAALYALLAGCCIGLAIPKRKDN